MIVVLIACALGGDRPSAMHWRWRCCVYFLCGKEFQGFYAPRFSPDGKLIVVATIGGPPTDQQGAPIKASVRSVIDRLLGLFEPATVEAHGLPWDL